MKTGVWLSAVLLLLVRIASSQKDNVPLPSGCQSDEAFDSGKFQCLPCPGGKDRPMVQAPDGISCTCKPGYVIQYSSTGDISCIKCPQEQVPTRDRHNCIQCQKYDNKKGKCAQCQPNEIQVERSANGTLLPKIECLRCGNGTTSSPDQLSCIPYGTHVVGTATYDSYACTSPGNILFDGVCLAKSALDTLPDTSRGYQIHLQNGESVESPLLRTLARPAHYMCKANNHTACQILRNLCVLVHYDDSEDSPCALLRKISDTSWPYNSESDASIVLSRTNLPFIYGLDPGRRELNFSVASFGLDGTFKGVVPLKYVLSKFCPEGQRKFDTAFSFAAKFTFECHISKPIGVSGEFYDLFLVQWTGQQKSLFAVPLLNKQLNKGGSFVNQGSEETRWQLVHRFFLLDSASSYPRMRYLQSLTISVTMQDGPEPGRIYPPLAILEYADDPSSDLILTMQVTYQSDERRPRENLTIAIGVMSALAAVWAAIQTWSWSRRSGRIAIDIVTLGNLVLNACGCLSNVFFVVVFFASLYWFVFFKGQKAVYTLLPSEEMEGTIKSYIVAIFALKIVHILHFLGEQVFVDIFFVDWERARARGDDGGGDQQQVSAWRTYFVANEWNKIQARRRTCFPLQLVATLFVLKVTDAEEYASPQPSISNSNSGDSSCTICFLAMGTAVYLGIYVAQMSFLSVVYERYLKNRVQQFVDICALSNISVFILAHERFGYYIHGRSPHGFADTDMRTMVNQLQMEEEDLCGHRGLLPSTDQQTFQMSVPQKMREYYDRVMSPIHVNQATRKLSANRLKTPVRNLEGSVEAYQRMNTFLGAFLEHAMAQQDYDVRNKQKMETLLDMEFQEPQEKTIFYNDNGHSYDAVLFCGNEFTLATLDVTAFSFMSVISHDFILAIAFTYVIASVVKLIRHIGGRKNLARKTLIDERFLL